ncbi:MAG: hypothetical protein ACODAB_04050 [Gemmatimonadota bacterium]
MLAAVGALSWASPAIAQEDAPADTAAVPDTVAAPPDTMIGELPGELVGVLADSAADSAFAVLADPLRPAPDRLAGEVIVWDRERIRRSNALHLGELPAEAAPGSLLLRAGFVGGPAHLLDGPLGPGSLDIRVDGRPIVPVTGAQVDLSQVLLALIDEVRVRRYAAGWRVDLTTLRRTERPAYSRIEAGSGDPGLESLRLVFTNGIGSAFAATAGFELLDSENPTSDVQGFSGGLAWMPGGGSSGVELQYEQRSFEQTVFDERTGTRSRLVLGGRVGLAEHVQASAWVGESARELDAAPAGGSEGEDATDLRAAAAHGGVGLRGVWERAWGAIDLRLADDATLPSRDVEVEGGVRPTPWLTLDASTRIGAWEEFDTREGHVGAAALLPAGSVDLRVYLQLGSGVRGVSYLAAEAADPGAPAADSVEFEAALGGFEAALAGLRVGGRVTRQRVDRQVVFGTGFDAPAGQAGPAAELIGWEGVLDAPILPLSWLGDEFGPIRVRGFVRHNQIRSAVTPFYVPANAIRGEIYFEDDFLQNDLGVRLAIGIDRRDAWLAPSGPGVDASPVEVPARTSLNFDLGLRIIDGLIFWRVDNVASRRQQDLPGFEFPVLRQVFGVRWAFRD